MGVTLTSKTINSTYDSLLKLSDNDQLTGAFKVITDGLGNDTGISINNTNQVNIAGQLVVNSSITANSFVRSGGLSTQFLKADGSVDSNTYQSVHQKGLANGYAPLDGGAKISEAYLPDSIVGQLEYQGTWNATTNTPTLPSASTVKGHYYVTSVAGTYQTIEYAIGDWVISNGTSWEKVDNTDAVTTVFGRIGAIVANSNDYSTFYHPKNGDLAANASTATTLQTARFINGTSFNGSGNITTAIWGTTRTITIGDTAKSVSGGSDVDWSRTELGITKTNIDALNINAATLGTYNSGQFLRSDVADSATNLTVNTLTIGTSNYIKFANNDYIRYDDANGVGRFHFDSDGGTNNASLQAALFVGDLQGNASSASLLGDFDSTQFLRSDTSDTMSGTLTVDNDVVIKRGATSGKQSYHSLYIGGKGLNSANSAIYIGNEGDGSGYGYELFYEGTGTGNNNKFKLISENLGTPKVAFEVTQDGDVTFPNNVVVTGSINIDAADLNIGAANLIFSTQSTQAVRGLIWEVNGGFLSKIDGGGTNGGLVELYANLDGAITNGDVFRIKQGSTPLSALSIAGNGYTNITSRLAVGKTTAPSTTLDVAGSILASGNITLNSGQMLASGGNSSQWTSAYSWGDHSLAGYVTISGTQTITGRKTFNTGSYNPLSLDRNAANVNMSFYHFGALKGYLGVGSTSVLTWGSSPDSSQNSIIYHTGNFTNNSTNWNTAYSWGDWSDGVTKTFIDNLNVDADTLDGYDSSVMWKKGTDIPSGADLNLYTSDGYYHQNGNAAAAAGTNYPQALAGMLSVQSDGLMVYQTYQVYNSSTNTYRRGYYNGTWHSWKRVLMDNDSINADTLDSLDSSQFLRSDTSDAMTGNLTITGNVGIGTSNPAYKLDVIGDGIRNIRSTAGWAGWFENTNNSSGVVVTAGVDSGDAPLLIRKQNGTELFSVRGDGTSWFSNGNVGIGTSSPANKLSVIGAGRVFNATSTNDEVVASISRLGGALSTLGFNGVGSTSDYHVRIGADATHFVAYTSNTERMRILNNGNVGIGTTSPDVPLEVVSASPANGIIADFVNSTNAGGTTAAIKLSNADSEACDVILGANRVGANFGSDFFISLSDSVDGSNQERFRITEAGNVGIGTTSPQAPLHIKQQSVGVASVYSSTIIEGADAQLDIISSSAGTWGSSLNLVEGIGSSNNNIWSIARTTSGGGNNLRFNFGTNNQHDNPTKFIIDSAGNVGIGTTEPSEKLHVVSSNLGGTVNNTTTQAVFVSQNANFSELHIQDYRTSTGGDWVSSGKRIQEKIDSTWMGYMQFNGTGNNGGISFGTGLSTTQSSVAEKMRIDSSGNVGIGTTSPSQKLEVNGNIQLTNQANSILFGSAGAAGTWGAPKISRINSNIIISDYNGVQLGGYDGTSYGPRVTIKGTGNVGIGTATPVGKLNVALPADSDGNVAAWSSNQVVFTRGGTNTSQGLGFSVDDAANSATISSLTPAITWSDLVYRAKNHVFYGNGGALGMYVNISGNVGIGTTSPSAKLEVFGTGNTLRLDSAANGSKEILFRNVGTGIATIKTDGDLKLFVEDAGKNILFDTNGGEKMRITPSGRVGIGTTSPEAELHIYGAHPYIYITNTEENDGGIVFNDAQATTGQAASIKFNCGSETLGFFVNDASAERVRIQTNGDTHFSGDVVAYSTSISDERLKDNIETIPNALDKVNLLRGVSYVWNKGSRKGQKDLGLIAQEVEKVLPEIVREKEMSLIDDSGIAYKTIDYEKMVGVMIEAIKEQQQQIDELKKRLDACSK